MHDACACGVCVCRPAAALAAGHRRTHVSVLQDGDVAIALHSLADDGGVYTKSIYIS